MTSTKRMWRYPTGSDVSKNFLLKVIWEIFQDIESAKGNMLEVDPYDNLPRIEKVFTLSPKLYNKRKASTVGTTLDKIFTS